MQGTKLLKGTAPPKVQSRLNFIAARKKLSAKCLYVYLRQVHPTTAPSQPPPPSNCNHSHHKHESKSK